MKVCLNCGHSNPDSLEYCEVCGKEVWKENIYNPPRPEKDKEGEVNID
jgi:uncharacterized membrane protein YvbJ